MNGLDTISPPPTADIDDGEQKYWTFYCTNTEEVPKDAREAALDMFTAQGKSFGFVHAPPTDEYMMLFGELGHMDEAVASAVITLRSLVSIVKTPIQRIQMSCHDDWLNKDDASARGQFFDVTQTVLSNL